MKKLLILLARATQAANADIPALDIISNTITIPKLIVINSETGEYLTLGNVSAKITIDQSSVNYLDCNKQRFDLSFFGPTNPCLLR